MSSIENVENAKKGSFLAFIGNYWSIAEGLVIIGLMSLLGTLSTLEIMAVTILVFVGVFILVVLSLGGKKVQVHFRGKVLSSRTFRFLFLAELYFRISLTVVFAACVLYETAKSFV